MAVNPYDKAHELARAITESAQYLNYIEAQKVIENKPELKDKLLQLRSQQIELNRAQALGEEIDQELMVQVSSEFAKLNQIQELANFFAAEGQFIILFNDIQQIIQKKVEQGLE